MIHQYKLNGYNIVLDVNSGSVHSVDDVAYDIIRFYCTEKEANPDKDVDKEKIKEETKATIRCIPFESFNPDDKEPGKCMVTGKPSACRVLFARSY